MEDYMCFGLVIF